MAAARSEPPDDRRPIGLFEWLRLLRRIRIPWSVKSFGVLLASYADPDGSRVHPGVDLLMDVTGLGEATVRRRLGELREYGLLGQTRRGGGRNGTGVTSEYQLTIPVDLLDRFELLPPGDKPKSKGHLSPVHSEQSPADDWEITQMIGHSSAQPVDNSTLTDHPGDRSNVDENDFHRSLGTKKERLSDQNELLTDHPGDRLPPTRPPTLDHPPTTPDPTQPPTAREDGSQEDHGDGEGVTAGEARPKCRHNLPPSYWDDRVPPCAFCREAGQCQSAEPSERCAHNLPRRFRGDGMPTCAFCRRDAAQRPSDTATAPKPPAEAENATQGPKRPQKRTQPHRRKPRKPRSPT